MFTDRLIPDDDGIDETGEIARVGEVYADVPGFLDSKPDPCVFLALSDVGMSFFYNFEDRCKIGDFLGAIAVATHSIYAEERGLEAADALIARALSAAVGDTD